MKNSSILITALLIVQAAWLSGQDQPVLRTYSAGLRVANFLDLPNYKFDSDLSTDPRGLNGKGTSFDLGMDLYGEVQINPLIGFQAGLRFGGTSGANEVEYYNNSFHEVYTDMILILSNLDRMYAEAPLNLYARLGLGYGQYKASRYLLADNSFNGGLQSAFWDGRVGAGVQYELLPYLRLELDASYNVVFDDGFDGFDHGNGNDTYFSTGIGVAYTFGKPREEVVPMYSVGFFSAAYTGAYDAAAKQDMKAENDSLTSFISLLAANMEELNQQLEQVRNRLDDQHELSAGQQKAISHNEKEIRALKAAAAKDTPAGEPETYWEQELKKVQVYFEFDSEGLTPETARILTEALKNVSGEISITGYASVEGNPVYNEKLKERRVQKVKSYLVEELNIDPAKITEAAAEEEELNEEDHLNRKVVVKY